MAVVAWNTYVIYSNLSILTSPDRIMSLELNETQGTWLWMKNVDHSMCLVLQSQRLENHVIAIHLGQRYQIVLTITISEDIWQLAFAKLTLELFIVNASVMRSDCSVFLGLYPILKAIKVNKFYATSALTNLQHGVVFIKVVHPADPTLGLSLWDNAHMIFRLKRWWQTKMFRAWYITRNTVIFRIFV